MKRSDPVSHQHKSRGRASGAQIYLAPPDLSFNNGEHSPCQSNMNSFTNFVDASAPNRPQPTPTTSQQQLNGLGARHWPDLGVQMDMNTLWEYVNNLSQLHEGIRAQTQSVLHGVQQIQARAAQEGSSPTVAQVNGALNGAYFMFIFHIVRKFSHLAIN